MNEELQRRLEALNLKFRAQLPAQLAGIETALAAALAADDDALAARLDELHRALHGLSGAAGTFGMAQLGDEAYAVELALQAVQAQPPAQRRAALDAFLPQMQSLFDIARRRDLA